MMPRLISIVGLALAVSDALTAAYPRGVERSHVLASARDVGDSYDYVVVGGGTAGLTVADRLTEDGKTTVLVIEYGELANSPAIDNVQGGTQGMSASKFLYPVTSVPQEHLDGRRVPVLIGKVVGGSSAVNAMMTVRGTSEDYDRWGNFFGGSSDWSWKGLLPYFKKALSFVPPTEEVAQSTHMNYDTSFWGNTSGVYTGWPSYQYPGTVIQLEAFGELSGVEFPPDSGAGRAGAYWFPSFYSKAVNRSYARTGHWDNINRTNYHLLTNTKVNRIVLNGTTATGVTFLSPNGSTSSNATTPSTLVRANKEVILAAGGIHSPQILQLSGIGPKKLLSSANITTLVDLPGVGQNFQDHPMPSIAITMRSFDIRPSPSDMFRNTNFSAWAREVWAANKTGPNSLGVGNAAAWLPFPVISNRSEEIAKRLEEQDHSAYQPEATDPTVAAGYRAQMMAYAAALRSHNTAFYSGTVTGSPGSPVLVDLHPLSRGTVNIDPEDPEGREPLVDYRALSNPLDKAIMVDMLRFTRRYFFNTSLAQYSPREMQPGSDVEAEEDLAAWLVQTLTPTEFHPVGTCAMMPRELGGVVDEELKVYGVQNLRVVDGSIMPTLPGANTCQTVYAVAEKAADLIKAAARSPARRFLNTRRTGQAQAW